MLTFVVSMLVIWANFVFVKDPIPWITLIIGSSFGVAITLIINSKGEKMLTMLEESEKEKKEFSKFIVKNNSTQLGKIVASYFETINNNSYSTSQKRAALQAILPSTKTFINICEMTLPNIGNFISRHTLEDINKRFSILHKLLIILESGSDTKFEENISNLDAYTKQVVEALDKI